MSVGPHAITAMQSALVPDSPKQSYDMHRAIAGIVDAGSFTEVHEHFARNIICGLARCNRDDITLVSKAIAPAAQRRIHVFLATSAIHREHKLGMAKEQIIHAAVEGVKYARSLCEDVEFSPEDASRTELDFLVKVVEAAIGAGATTIAIAPEPLDRGSSRGRRSFVLGTQL